MTNKIYLESLGCSKNLVDSEVMLGLLSEGGCEIVDLPEKAEIIIINTCSFVEEAVKEAIETIYSLARKKSEGVCQYLIVCGCLPQRYGRELLKEMPEVDLFLGTGEFQNISSHIDKMINGQLNERKNVKQFQYISDE